MLVETLAERISDILRDGIRRRGQASLAVSGGSTPIPLFSHLAETDLDWSKVTVLLVDERWVEPDSPDSNENLVRSYLLKGKAAMASFVGMRTESPGAGFAEDACEKQLRTIPLPLDCLILGMGNDGHTASLFPGADTLEAAVDLHSGRICMAVRPPATPHERMTLTLPAILASRQLFLLLQGEKKKQVLARAQEVGDARQMPIRFILRQTTTPLAVYWSP